jgi:hypothetical protein
MVTVYEQYVEYNVVRAEAVRLGLILYDKQYCLCPIIPMLAALSGTVLRNTVLHPLQSNPSAKSLSDINLMILCTAAHRWPAHHALGATPAGAGHRAMATPTPMQMACREHSSRGSTQMIRATAPTNGHFNHCLLVCHCTRICHCGFCMFTAADCCDQHCRTW